MTGFRFQKKTNPRGEYKEDILAMLEAESVRRHNERRPLELSWMLCADFFSGHQYCDINPYRTELEEYAPLYDYMERGVYNRIAPLIETRLANFSALDFSMEVRPATGGLADYEKSRVATRLLHTAMETGGFAEKKDRLMRWCELCGTSFLLSWWDENGGECIRDGETCLPLGALGYGVLTPYEVLPESIGREELSDQNSILIEQVLPVAQIDRRYGVRVKPRRVESYTLSPTAGTGGLGYVGATFSVTRESAKDSTLLRTYMEKPSAYYPSGRMILATPDRILWYGTLPTETYPLAVLRCRRVPGMFFGRSVIEDLIPLQRAYNGVKNKIHDSIRTMAANPLLLPVGAVDDVDELAANGVAPGDILEYDPARGEPKPLAVQGLPESVFAECENIAKEMEYTAGLSHLGATGNFQTSLSSASAIESLRAIDGVRLALTADSIRAAVLSAAKTWLSLYRLHGSLPHPERAAGAETFVWSADDLNSADVVFLKENCLLHGEEEQRNALAEGVRLGLLSGEDGKIPSAVRRELLAKLGMGDLADAADESALQGAVARMENRSLLCGKAVPIGVCDDHGTHIAVHRRALLEHTCRGAADATGTLAAHIAAHTEKQNKEKNENHE